MLLPGREPEAGCGTQPCSHKEAGFSYLHPPFDLASDMKRHVSQVQGSKQNAAPAPHLCLHVIRSPARTCLAATDLYRPAALLTVTSALPSHGRVTSIEAALHLAPCSVRICVSHAPSLAFPFLFEHSWCGKCPQVSSSLPGTGDTDLHFRPELLPCFSKQLCAAHSRQSSNAAVGDIGPIWKPDLLFA